MNNRRRQRVARIEAKRPPPPPRDVIITRVQGTTSLDDLAAEVEAIFDRRRREERG